MWKGLTRTMATGTIRPNAALLHPLCFYIPKSESADEALWWRDLFQMVATDGKLVYELGDETARLSTIWP